MSSANEPEKPIQPWKYYSDLELSDYFLRNIDRADCSFFISDTTGNKDSKWELRSFKWMLCDISPVLKGILNDEKNRAKNFKMIPVPEKNFEALLSFAHAKIVRDESFSYLLDLYETAMKYESNSFRDAITAKLGEKDPIGNWIRFAALAWRDRYTNLGLKQVFQRMQNKYKEWKNKFDYELTTNLETSTHFDFRLFHALLCAMMDWNVNPLVRFKTVEAYVLKNISKGKTLEEMNDQKNFIKDTANIFLSRVEFGKMTAEDFDNGPAKSALLGEESKKVYRSVVAE